jgi:hypothetical protein
VMFVLGNVGQLQEVTEGADDGLRGIARQGVKEASQLIASGGSPSRAKRTAVLRTCSTMSKTDSPSCSRTVSPRMRPRRRMSLRSGSSLLLSSGS